MYAQGKVSSLELFSEALCQTIMSYQLDPGSSEQNQGPFVPARKA